MARLLALEIIDYCEFSGDAHFELLNANRQSTAALAAGFRFYLGGYIPRMRQIAVEVHANETCVFLRATLAEKVHFPRPSDVCSQPATTISGTLSLPISDAQVWRNVWKEAAARRPAWPSREPLSSGSRLTAV